MEELKKMSMESLDGKKKSKVILIHNLLLVLILILCRIKSLTCIISECAKWRELQDGFEQVRAGGGVSVPRRHSVK